MSKEFYIILSIEGTEYADYKVTVSQINLPVNEQIKRMKKAFELPCENDYVLARKIREVCGRELVEIISEEKYNRTFSDVEIHNGDTLFLLLKNTYKSRDKEDFIVNLTIEGTEYEDVEVHITKPDETLREHIEKIVSVFELPKIDNGGNCLIYLLGREISEGEDPEIMEFEDYDGRELTLHDYNVHIGDKLHLISVPIAGYACPVPLEMNEKWNEIYSRLMCI